MSLPAAAPEPQEFPAYRLREFLPAFVLGWALGAAAVFALRWLGTQLLTDPCQGRTVVALALPLLMGPGGLAFTALSWRKPGRAALGLGLVVASLLPGLFVGARDIGHLRTVGCAGGYVVLSTPGTKSVSSLALQAGQSRQLTGRIGGFTAQNHPGLFTLKADTDTAKISVELPRTQVRAGESFTVEITAAPDAPLNTFKAGVQATQTADGKTYQADGLLEITVRP